MPWTVTYLMSKGTRLVKGDPSYVPPPILAERWFGDLMPSHGPGPANEVLMEEVEKHILERAKVLYTRGLFSGGQWLVDVTGLALALEADKPQLLVDLHLARPGFLPPGNEHYRALLDNMILTAGGPWRVASLDTTTEPAAFSPSQARGWPDGVTRIRSAAHVAMYLELPTIGWKGLTTTSK